MSIFRQLGRGLIFLEALLATEEEFLSPVRYSEGLAPGNVTTANRVADQILFSAFRTGNFPLGGKEGPFYHAVDDRCQNQNRNQTVHVLTFPS